MCLELANAVMSLKPWPSDCLSVPKTKGAAEGPPHPGLILGMLGAGAIVMLSPIVLASWGEMEMSDLSTDTISVTIATKPMSRHSLAL